MTIPIREKKTPVFDFSKARQILQTKGADLNRKYYEALAGNIEGTLSIPNFPNAIYARLTGEVEAMIVRCNVASPVDALQYNAPIEIYYSRKNNCWVWDGKMPIVAYDIANGGAPPSTLVSNATYIVREANANLPNAQALDDLVPGLVTNGEDGTLTSLAGTNVGDVPTWDGDEWLSAAPLPVDDDKPLVFKTGAPTARVRVAADNVTPGQTRVLTMPDADVSLPKNNLSAITSPTASNDNTQGYSVGSLWQDNIAVKVFRCYAANTGAAVWHQIYPSVTNWGAPGADIGNVTPPNFIYGGSLIGSTAVTAPQLNGTNLSLSNDANVTGTVNAANVVPTNRIARPGVTPSVANGDMGYGSGRAMSLIAGRVNYESSAMGVQAATTLCHNTAAETALLTSVTGSIGTPASFFNTGRALRIRARGAIAISSITMVNFTWRLYLGATVIWNLTVPYSFTVTSGYSLDIDILCYTTGSTATIQCNGNYDHHMVPANIRFDANFTPFNINTAASNAFSLTAQWGTASASYGLSLRMFKLLMEM